MSVIQIKRAYDAAEPTDGYRIYVDRLWPRGLSHTSFHYDLWDKDIAPSDELREWFHGAGSDSQSASDIDSRWKEFAVRYEDELKANPAYKQLRETVDAHSVVTLLFSSRDRVHNNAVVLAELLEKFD